MPTGRSRVGDLASSAATTRANNWKRDDAYLAVFENDIPSSGRIVAVEGSAISNPTTLDHLTIKTGNAGSGGVSTYGLRAPAARRWWCTA